MIVLRIHWNLLHANRPNPERRATDAWQRYREQLFAQTALRSLQRQTVSDWQAWLRCDPELRHLTDGMADRLGEPRVRVVYDFNAACRALAAEDAARPLVFGRLDSDDLLAPGALTRWRTEPEGLVQFGDGYALDTHTGGLFEWNHPSAPFIARVGDASMCAAGQPAWLGVNHGKIYEIARRIDDDRWYMVTVHGDNQCNRLPASWSGRQITGNEKQRILARFGLPPSGQLTTE